MKRILIVKLSALGDVIHLSWILPAIKKTYPSVIIDWVVEYRFNQFLHLYSEVDNVISLGDGVSDGLGGKLKKLIRFVNKIRSHRYDAVIDAQGLLRSSLVLAISRSSKKIGFAPPVAREGSYFFYNIHSKKSANEINVMDKYLSLFKEIGVSMYISQRPLLNFKKVNPDRIKTFIQNCNANKKIVLNPSASFYTKTYPVDKIATLAERIRATFAVPLIVLNNGEESFDEIGHHPDIVIAPKLSLEELLLFFKQCDILIGVDSGPSYMPELVGTFSLILFGPTNLKRQSPSESRDPQLRSLFRLNHEAKSRSIYSDYECPIIKPGVIYTPYRCLNIRCSDNLCMKRFDTSRILEQVNEIIS